ncbi:MAG: diaminopropionate ammonia-lyase [Gemmatimonadota bacterium]|nr:MAG: diaminopropionate ammonia-lyase [Gemmatimonadota bacterium]
MIPLSSFRIVPNTTVDRSLTFGESAVRALEGALGDEIDLRTSFRIARSEITTWPDYCPTPLVEMSGLARDLGVQQLLYKDEGWRFGLSSFKAMGGGYAVSRIVARYAMESTHAANMTSKDLLSGRYSSATSQVTVTCATDGNHGRSVAWAAREFGCKSVIYMASIVSPFREQAMISLGAEVVRSQGNHEDAAAECRAAASERGWFVVSETENATEPAIAADTLAGYATIMSEVAKRLPSGEPPTHVFVQAGVGGLAATSAVFCGLQWPQERPRLVVVESDQADCILRSIEAGEPITVTGDLDTVMAGLAAGEVSSYAWSILRTGADYAMAIPDEAAVATMQLLATPQSGDTPVVAGESGVASLAAALLVLQNNAVREQLGITRAARILTIGTEGATDPEVYRRLVGLSPEEVMRRT